MTEFDADPTAPRRKIHELSKAAHDEWITLSPEEQNAVTAEASKELQEIRQMKADIISAQSMNAFNDARQTFDRLEKEVSHCTLCLRNRCSYHCLVN